MDNSINNITDTIIEYALSLKPVELLETTDKIIWSYWNDTNLPEVVKLSIYTWKNNNPNYIICVLTENTLEQYINVNEFPKYYFDKSHTYKSDIIRLTLLEKYGGIWIDSSMLINESLSLTWEPKNFDVGGYYLRSFTTNIDKPVFESWFIAAPKNSILIKEWKKELYLSCSYKNINDYINYLKHGLHIDLQKIETPGYLAIHCCFLKVINDTTYNIKIFNAEDGPYDYICKHNWVTSSAINYLLQPTTDEIPKSMKLRGPERNGIILQYNKKGSIIDRIITNNNFTLQKNNKILLINEELLNKYGEKFNIKK